MLNKFHLVFLSLLILNGVVAVSAQSTTHRLTTRLHALTQSHNQVLSAPFPDPQSRLFFDLLKIVEEEIREDPLNTEAALANLASLRDFVVKVVKKQQPADPRFRGALATLFSYAELHTGMQLQLSERELIAHLQAIAFAEHLAGTPNSILIAQKLTAKEIQELERLGTFRASKNHQNFHLFNQWAFYEDSTGTTIQDIPIRRAIATPEFGRLRNRLASMGIDRERFIDGFTVSLLQGGIRLEPQTVREIVSRIYDSNIENIEGLCAACKTLASAKVHRILYPTFIKQLRYFVLNPPVAQIFFQPSGQGIKLPEFRCPRAVSAPGTSRPQERAE